MYSLKSGCNYTHVCKNLITAKHLTHMFHTHSKDGRDAHCAMHPVCITISNKEIGRKFDFDYVPLYVSMVTVFFGPP